MLEIKSEYKEFINDDGTFDNFFIISMTRNDTTLCSSFRESDINFNDGEILLKTLIHIFSELIKNLYPEMNDPLIKARRKLIELEYEVRFTKTMIKDLESK